LRLSSRPRRLPPRRTLSSHRHRYRHPGHDRGRRSGNSRGYGHQQHLLDGICSNGDREPPVLLGTDHSGQRARLRPAEPAEAHLLRQHATGSRCHHEHHPVAEIRGIAELTEDPHKTLPVLLSRKYLGEDPPPEPGHVRRLIVRVLPQKINSFSVLPDRRLASRSQILPLPWRYYH